jgi:hypothetical protein
VRFVELSRAYIADVLGGGCRSRSVPRQLHEAHDQENY